MLKSLTQRQGEKVNSFYDRVFAGVAIYYRSLVGDGEMSKDTRNAREHIFTGLFVAGLRDEIRAVVQSRMSVLDDADDLLRAALDAERSYATATIFAVERDLDVQALDQRGRARGRFRGGFRGMGRGNARGGAQASNQNQPANRGRNNGGRGRYVHLPPNQRPNQNFSCFRCGRRGHYAAECRTPQNQIANVEQAEYRDLQDEVFSTNQGN